jgi:superfamily I DNA and RNA helicase
MKEEIRTPTPEEKEQREMIIHQMSRIELWSEVFNLESENKRLLEEIEALKKERDKYKRFKDDQDFQRKHS